MWITGDTPLALLNEACGFLRRSDFTFKIHARQRLKQRGVSEHSASPVFFSTQIKHFPGKPHEKHSGVI
jgi:hypothetical protein